MPGTRPPATPADGNTRRVFLAAMAGATPTLEEAIAVGNAEVEPYFTYGGFVLGLSTATFQDNRDSDTTVREAAGQETYTLTVTGIDNTNTEYEEEHNLLVEEMVQGEEVLCLERPGLPWDQQFVATEKCRLIRFRPGRRMPVPPEQNGRQRSTWQCFEVDVLDVVLPAAAGG